MARIDSKIERSAAGAFEEVRALVEQLKANPNGRGADIARLTLTSMREVLDRCIAAFQQSPTDQAARKSLNLLLMLRAEVDEVTQFTAQ